MYLAIIMLPLLGSIVSGFFGRKVGVKGAQILSSLCVIITTILAITVFFEVALNNISVQIQICRWLDLELINVSWGFNFDSLTVSMLIPVLIISSLVHVYSIGYMSHDPHNQRFFSYLSLFTFMMIILVTANNFLLMFVGWEGVGVCSYLLVSFWFTRIAANQSSMSAFLTNRVGDCFLTLGMFVLLLTFGNLDYSTIFSLAPFVNEDIITLIGVCLLIGAMAKSSQIGLHVWLPLAMEGPTPVSALIHAATMVTAGVYLLIRVSPLIEYSSTVLVTALWIGSVTTVFSSLIGLFQQDIKKVIAYSTMSQLGMMVIAIGLSSYNLALFHLVNHAFYKGLLFLAAGAVIHAIADNQDFRKYGGLILFLPLSYTVMLIASLSLVAFPFMTGFYSKDFILESSYAQYTYSSTAVYFTALVGAMFTTLYSAKVLYLTFLSNANAPITNYNKAHEGNMYMSIPLIILALFSIFFGYFTKDIFIGLGSNIFSDNSIFIHPLHEISINSEFAVPHEIKLLPFMLTVVIIVLSVLILEYYSVILLRLKFSRLGYNIFSFLNLKFLFETIYNRFVTYLVLNLGGQTTKILDKGSIEKLGPYGLEKGLIMLSRSLSKLDTGVVTSYALYILVGFLLYISIPYVFFTNQDILLLVMYCTIIHVIKSDKDNTTYNVIKPSIVPRSYNLFKDDLIVYGLVALVSASIIYTLECAVTEETLKSGVDAGKSMFDSITDSNTNKNVDPTPSNLSLEQRSDTNYKFWFRVVYSIVIVGGILYFTGATPNELHTLQLSPVTEKHTFVDHTNIFSPVLDLGTSTTRFFPFVPNSEFTKNFLLYSVERTPQINLVPEVRMLSDTMDYFGIDRLFTHCDINQHTLYLYNALDFTNCKEIHMHFVKAWANTFVGNVDVIRIVDIAYIYGINIERLYYFVEHLAV